ncbi:MAG: DNA recombination protein RmuC [Actinomycetota bacterium]
MDLIGLLVGLVLGLVAGGALAALWWQRRLSDERTRAAAELRAVESAGTERLTELERAARHEIEVVRHRESEAVARVAALEGAQRNEERLLEAFGALSNDALDASTRRFLELANERFARLEAAAKQESTEREQVVHGLVAPVQEHLGKLASQLEQVERVRQRDTGSLREALQQLQRTATGLQSETKTLAAAMKDVRARGSWGELQLRRVVELAGMIPHCDFDEQLHVAGADRSVRPDLVVWLPRGRAVVVDAKVPLDAYLEATHADDERVANERLAAHAAAMRQHATALAKRDYAGAVEGAVDIVVMFVPGESFLAAACEQDPLLLDRALADGVVLATPTTLVALLKAVALGWREERLAQDARVIADLGRELHDRTVTFAEHLAKVGRTLESSVKSYNAAVGSLESRVLPSARRLSEHGASPKELPSLSAVDLAPRALAADAPLEVEDGEGSDGAGPRLVS